MKAANYLVSADRLNQALAQITKTPALTAGILQDAAEVIAKEGCLAMNTTRVGIWSVNYEKEQLESITSYSLHDRCHCVQGHFPFDDKPHYISLLISERFLVINDADKDILIPSIKDIYGPNLCSLLDAPIRVGGKLVGVVCIEQFNTPRYWTSVEHNFAGSLADFMALAMESAERHLAMQELAQSKRLTETLMSNLPGMVYQCLTNPPNFTITFASEGCLPLTGYTPEELINNPSMNFFDLVHPEDVEGLKEANKRTLLRGLPLETTFRIIMKNRTVKWLWERSRVVEYNEDGTPHLLEGFYTDVTDQRRLETAEFANRAKNEFLSKISHEIRTPMNMLHGITDLAIRLHPSENTFDYLLNIKTAANSLLTITNDLLDLSKIETRPDEIILEPYYVPSLINDVVILTHVRIGNKPIEFIVEDCPNLPRMLMGDCVRLKQVLTQLLNNATKFTDEGQITLSLESIPTNSNEAIILKGCVTHTGISLKEEGVGLELSIARNLLELMGGSLSTKTTENAGSLFIFEVVQGIMDIRPSVQTEKRHRQVGVWLESQAKADSLVRKLTSLGFEASIVPGTEAFAGRTDIFFDYSNAGLINAEQFPEIRLIGLAKQYTDNRHLPSNMQVVYSPLTSLFTTQLLAEKSNDPFGYLQKITQGSLWTQNARLLVVDDDDNNLIIADSVLKDYGAEVDLATSSEQALKLVAENDYDIVFLDHMMPKMNGTEVATLIRKMFGERFRVLPLVALTANAVSNVWSMFAEKGMNDFLSKPLNVKELERVLCTWLPKEKWNRAE